MLNPTRFSFTEISPEWISNNFTVRAGEIKLGQKVKTGINTSSKYQVLGVCESVGPQLNGGKTGAEFGFQAFANRFLNMQSNRFLVGDEICFSGMVTLNQSNESPTFEWIDELDELLFSWASTIFNQGGIPIVIGGGHNNAYPLIKSAANFHQKAIGVVNLDPHADFRKTDGRHSGNPFSYASEQTYLNKYAVLGLHESYNNEHIFEELEKANAYFCFFESWLDDGQLFEQHLQEAKNYLEKEYFGLELDLDSIAYMPSSAISPSGVTLEQARKYVRLFSSNKNCSYLHLPEAAPMNESEALIVGKALAFLVSDFIKSNKRANFKEEK